MEEIKTGFTRVTEVLQLYNSYASVDPRVLHYAADRGTRVHRYCELHALGEYYPTPDEEISGYVNSFTQWYDAMVDKVLSLELRIYDELLRITGQLDMIAILKNDSKPTIVDFKTPATTSKTWQIQLAAYKYLAEREGLEIDRRIALKLLKTGEIAQVIEYTNHKEDFEIFKGILQAHRFFNV